MGAQSLGPRGGGQAAGLPGRRAARLLRFPSWCKGGPVQVTIYLTEEDSYLLRLIDEKSLKERKSRAVVVLSIMEEYFEKGHRLGGILIDLGVLLEKNLADALALQRRFT